MIFSELNGLNNIAISTFLHSLHSLVYEILIVANHAQVKNPTLYYFGFFSLLFFRLITSDMIKMGISSKVWCFVCLSWRSSNGEWAIRVNSVISSSGKGLKTNDVIKNGHLTVGKMSESSVGSCEQVKCFLGEITQFNLWDKRLTEDDFKNVHSVCGGLGGNILAWNTLKVWFNGNITLQPVTLCTSIGKYILL